MEYTPREGVDFITDYYLLLGIRSDADQADIKKIINEQSMGYHPDLLQRLAPEFQAKGERMTRLMNKARGILLDPEARAQYDGIRDNWQGAFSSTGDPVITLERLAQAEMAMKQPDEIDAAFATSDEKIDSMTSYSQERLEFLEQMIGAYGADLPAALRQQYEEALMDYDRNLALKESSRAGLLGLPDLESNSFRVALGYEEEIALHLEAAEISQLTELRSIAIVETAQKLAVLAGEATTDSSIQPVDVSTIRLPNYFKPIAQQISGIAKLREEVLMKRLSVFEPYYPEAENQQEVKPAVILGLIGSGRTDWFTFKLDIANGSADTVALPADVAVMLNRKDYNAVFERGFNVATFAPLDHVDLQTLLSEAINKYQDKYYPIDNTQE